MNPPQAPYNVGTRPAPELASSLLAHSFGWMFAGLLLTSGIAAVVATNQKVVNTVADYWYLIFIGQLVLAIGIQGLIGRISASTALALFFVFAATMGFTVGVIVTLYEQPSVISSFFSAAAMFGAAALYGATTRRSLAGLGGYLSMGMIGLFVALLVNLFLGNGVAGFVIAAIGVVIFVVYTAYDVQRISYGDYVTSTGSIEKASVLGAVHLYINFVNIFLFLLRLMGSRN